MKDDLEKLRQALKDQVPTSDASRKAQNIAAARLSFEALQGLPAETRPIPDRARMGGWITERIGQMIERVSTRAAVLTTSSLAVLALGLIAVTQTGLQDQLAGPRSVLDAEVAQKQAEPLQRELIADAVSGGEENLVRLRSEPAVMSKAERTRGDFAEALAPMVAAPAPTIVMTETVRQAPQVADDRFPAAEANGLKLTAREPVSTFSVDVDTTSYSFMRMAALDGYPLAPDAVRVEEMINYFDYSYPVPTDRDTPFTTSVSVMETPWNADTRLMQIGIQGYEIAPEQRPDMGLVFLIDTSGSMNSPLKLPLLIKSFEMLLSTLGPDDTVSIVTYAGSAGMALEPTPASEVQKIKAALADLAAGGSTAGQAGLAQAYAIAEEMQKDGQEARIILATDGDFNVGISNPEALKDYVAEKRESGVYLSVLGFGRGNYTDTVMQAIAQNGNGVAAYIDSLAEAQKVLVEDVTASLVAIASDVKIQVEFNPAQISEYRLIGYETRALNREDFNNDAVDAGEIGAGHTVTAIYEITPNGSPAELVDELRYSESRVKDTSDEYAFVKLRYKRPGEAASNLVETPVSADSVEIPAEEARFAASVAAAGQILGGRELGNFTLSDARRLAASNRGEDAFGYRAEFVKLLGLLEAR